MRVFGSAISATVLGLFVFSASAAPTNANEKRADCVVNAAIIDQWSENALARYRVAFSTSRTDVDLGTGCSLFSDGIDNCSALDNNISCYYSDAAGSWVVDNNQVAGAGNSIEDCLVRNFISSLATAADCGTG